MTLTVNRSRAVECMGDSGSTRCFWTLLVVLCVAFLVGCGSEKPPRDGVIGADFFPDGKSIVFSYGGRNAADIYRALSDGSNVERLAGDEGIDEWPACSPDGLRIVFSSTRGEGEAGFADIYVMNADGSDVKRLTEGPAVDTGPLFSPDGKSIYFMRARGYENYSPIAPKQWHGWDIFRLDADGGNLAAITKGNYYGMRGLSISSDGRNLLTTIVGGGRDVAWSIDLGAKEQPKPMRPIMPKVSQEVVRQRGGEPLLTKTCSWYSLSHDGKYVAIVGAGLAWGDAIYLMDWGKREITRTLTHLPAFIRDPRFSPDGKNVIFLKKIGMRQNAYHELWEVTTDGNGQERRIDLQMPQGQEKARGM